MYLLENHEKNAVSDFPTANSTKDSEKQEDEETKLIYSLTDYFKGLDPGKYYGKNCDYSIFLKRFI